jgi:hypothetical protein
MVEPQIVVLVVAGSSPVGHPVFAGVMEYWSAGVLSNPCPITPRLHYSISAQCL